MPLQLMSTAPPRWIALGVRPDGRSLTFGSDKDRSRACRLARRETEDSWFSPAVVVECGPGALLPDTTPYPTFEYLR